MSSGVYALIGVVVGGLITTVTQIGVGWWRGRQEWKVATRLVTDELEQLMMDLRFLIQNREIPLVTETAFRTEAWEEYRAVIARALKNDAEGDQLWRGLSSIYGTARDLRAAISAAAAGGTLKDQTVEWLRDKFAEIGRAYESLTGVPSDVDLVSQSAVIGAQTGAQMP